MGSVRRLAMLLRRLTTDPGLPGADTDDEFTIDVVTGETVFLVAAATVLGVTGSFVYLAIRP